MKLQGWLALMGLICVAANYLHWRRQVAHKFFIFPTEVGLKLFFMGSLVLMMALNLLAIAGYISMGIFAAVLMGFTMAYNLYSLWKRVQLGKAG